MAEHSSTPDLSEDDVGGGRQDELFEVLSHPHRRFALQYLRAAETPLSVEELATELAVWESQRPIDDRTGGSREGIETSLVHRHLPKIDEAGLVEYDPNRQTVTLADSAGAVQEQLQAMATE